MVVYRDTRFRVLINVYGIFILIASIGRFVATAGPNHA